jgi:hypothetical protein
MSLTASKALRCQDDSICRVIDIQQSEMIEGLALLGILAAAAVAKQPSAPAASPAVLRELPWGQLK